jgi:hypothetical protein
MVICQLEGKTRDLQERHKGPKRFHLESQSREGRPNIAISAYAFGTLTNPTPDIFAKTRAVKRERRLISHAMCGRVIQSSGPLRYAIVDGMNVRDTLTANR